MRQYTLYECHVCEFDCVLEVSLDTPYCPVCQEDNGRDISMTNCGPPSSDKKVEGIDMRTDNVTQIIRHGS